MHAHHGLFTNVVHKTRPRGGFSPRLVSPVGWVMDWTFFRHARTPGSPCIGSKQGSRSNCGSHPHIHPHIESRAACASLCLQRMNAGCTHIVYHQTSSKFPARGGRCYLKMGRKVELKWVSCDEYLNSSVTYVGVRPGVSWLTLPNNATATRPACGKNPKPSATRIYGDKCARVMEASRLDDLEEQHARQRLETAAAGILRAPLPKCGGVAFWHLPKASGSSLECFLGAQPEFACCYRGTCGACKHWPHKPSSDNELAHTMGAGRQAAQCHHRRLIDKTSWDLLVAADRDNTSRNQPSGTFQLPDALLRYAVRRDQKSASATAHATAAATTASLLGKLRIVTAFHGGPDAVAHGMDVGDTTLARFGFLRDRLFAPAGCKLVLLTFLRHPVDVIISAYHYTGQAKKGTSLASFARRHSASLLGTANGMFAPGKDGWYGARLHLLGGVPDATSTVTTRAYASYARRRADAQAAHALEPLLAQFDVVGHSERYDESLLLLIDAAGLQHPAACPSPHEPQQRQQRLQMPRARASGRA